MSKPGPGSENAGKLNVGDVVADRYRVTGIVGRGGMGAVYRALQLDTGVEVALKVLLTNYGSSEVDSKRFRREASLVQKLTHPNIVRQLDFGQTARGVPYIAFELLHGQPLGEHLKEVGCLDEVDVVTIATEVLGALSVAHRHGVVHRDIKPQNIFLIRPSNTSKLLDFGIAKTLETEGMQATQLTASGQMIGTPHYMAPEQVRGLKVGPTTDLYAVGLIMAEMLSGHRVVKGNAIIEVYITHIADEPLELHPTVKHSSLGAAIAKAIEKDPLKRFSTADEMLEALAQIDVRSVPSSGTKTIETVPEDGLNSTMLITTHMETVEKNVPPGRGDLLNETIDDLALTKDALEPVKQPESGGKTVMLSNEPDSSYGTHGAGALAGGLTTQPLDDDPSHATVSPESHRTRQRHRVAQMPRKEPRAHASPFAHAPSFDGPVGSFDGPVGVRESARAVQAGEHGHPKATSRPHVSVGEHGQAQQVQASPFAYAPSFDGRLDPSAHANAAQGHGQSPGQLLPQRQLNTPQLSAQSLPSNQQSHLGMQQAVSPHGEPSHGALRPSSEHRPQQPSYPLVRSSQLPPSRKEGVSLWLWVGVAVALVGCSALAIILIMRFG